MAEEMRSGVAAKLFAACLGCSLVDLVVLDFVVGPEALRNDAADAQGRKGETPPHRPTLEIAEAGAAAATPSAIPAPARPASETNSGATLARAHGRRIVARFESESPVADDTELRALAASMLADPTAEIVLEGHADQRGDPERNRMLSLDRAKWAQTRLVELGVSASRIAVVGVGAERPRETAEDDAAIANNRRVEVRWITGTPPAEDGDR